mmetsp:Transcript_27827/g.90509  ORF Transcript_27827/g.90509 Transcript_27827/m.90509 type:complete len:570 (-) Transcript_27827:110-1819(-)
MASSEDSDTTEISMLPSIEEKAVRKAEKRRFRPPIVCLAFSSASAEALTMVLKTVGWQSRDVLYEKSDIFWVSTLDQLLTRLKCISNRQVCSRIPGMYMLCDKCPFSKMMGRGRSIFRSLYDFYPESWLLPDDLKALSSACTSTKEFSIIVKPNSGSQGDGIFLVSSYEDLVKRISSAPERDLIAQRYIDRPLLLDGLKFDLRVYVLIRSIEPLDVWICHEGLARFCTDKYHLPNARNLSKVTSHLTNYSLNKLSDRFVRPDNSHMELQSDGEAATGEWGEEQERNASKRSISYVFQEISRLGYNTESIWEQIHDLVQQTCLLLRPSLCESIYELKARDPGLAGTSYSGGPSCFHLLGFDIMLDEKCKPWLLEMNCSPRVGIDDIEVVAKGTEAEGVKVCRCMEHHRPHVHFISEVDRRVKLQALGGALLLVSEGFKNSKVLSHGFRADSKKHQELLSQYKQICGEGVEVQHKELALIDRLHSLYIKVSGCKRKMDSSRLRFLVKELGLPQKEVRNAQLTIDSISLRARAKKAGLTGFDDFLDILIALGRSLYPSLSTFDALTEVCRSV